MFASNAPRTAGWFGRACVRDIARHGGRRHFKPFFAGDIECGADGTITIEIKNTTGEKELYPLKKGAEVFFDNRCLSAAPECANDFEHYYDVIKTKSEKFEIEYAPTLIDDWTKKNQAFRVMGVNYACEVAKVCCVEDPDDTLNNPKL